jgi:hypothetical protein
MCKCGYVRHTSAAIALSLHEFSGTQVRNTLIRRQSYQPMRSIKCMAPCCHLRTDVREPCQAAAGLCPGVYFLGEPSRSPPERLARPAAHCLGVADPSHVVWDR